MRIDLTCHVRFESAPRSGAAAVDVLEAVEARIVRAVADALHEAGVTAGGEAKVRFAGADHAGRNALDQLAAFRDHDEFELSERPAPPSLILGGAMKDVARRGAYRPAARPEAHLVAVVRDALRAQDGAAEVSDVEPRYALPGWTRSPGGVDLAVDDHAARRALVECKVDKPDESLWDALKLVDIVYMHHVDAGFLLYDATDAIWAAHPVAELFTSRARPWRVRELIERWPKAWGDLLYGGRGIRPRESVAKLHVAPVAAVSLAAGRTARLLHVAPAISRDRQYFDDDGWPTGYEPPANLRTRSRYVTDSAPATGDELDVCHEYTWYRTWTQKRLARLVPTLDDDAFECLRRRLAAERNWTEHDLRTRVDPLRSQTDREGT